MKPSAPLRVMLVDDDLERRSLIAGALAQAGLAVAAELGTADGLLRAVSVSKPDVVIIDLDSPDRDILENMRCLSRDNPHPVVMFASASDADTIRQAIEAGVSAYVVDGLQPGRVRAVVEVAIARFRQYASLQSELAQARTSLAQRKLVERAKGILMTRGGRSENDAYHALRKLAMDQNKTIAEIAQGVIDTAELFK
ncbi:ANTAR domain-containing response regulator [Immundisolibacter sp.]|uniref:ANTAR domain-containing response regulator n=1 Tax=Immundisolibacter sp. TaxID=1934948 RepID=UPI00261702EF|nr:ANTAR domain-containing protein [Immundisolibacter sp.]MDD3652452.1 ANTAR domain-containing protein [Immundisolibacter sp.]